jgi:hypothetical protein
MIIGRDCSGLPLIHHSSMRMNESQLQDELLWHTLEESAEKINAELNKSGWDLKVTVEKDTSRFYNKGYSLRVNGEIDYSGRHMNMPLTVQRAGVLIAETIKKHLPPQYKDRCPNFSIAKHDPVFVVNQD